MMEMDCKGKQANISTASKSLKPLNTSGNIEDLFSRIRGLFILGKMIGLIPLQGVFTRGGNSESLKYRPLRIGWWINASILTIVVFNATVCIIGFCKQRKQNAADLAWSAASVVFYMHGTLLYLYFLRHTSSLINLLKAWSKLDLHFDLRDASLSRDSSIITSVIFTSAVLENALLQFSEFPAFESNNLESPLKTYYLRAHGYWNDVIPYHWIWPLILFFSNKFTLYAWNFVDILIAVFSRALYEKFKLLNEAGEKVLALKDDMELLSYESKEISHSEGRRIEDPPLLAESQIFWSQLTKDHGKICHILREFEHFLSSLLFCSYTVNIYFTCLQLFIGLSPSKDAVAIPATITIHKSDVKSKLYSIYAAWSFIHLLMRLYIVTITAANVNFYAHQISRVLRKCPVQYYTTEVERLERKICGGAEIGLGGLGCFVVTKPFILSIIGVVFTFEIVLLQSSSSAPTNCPPNPQ